MRTKQDDTKVLAEAYNKVYNATQMIAEGDSMLTGTYANVQDIHDVIAEITHNVAMDVGIPVSSSEDFLSYFWENTPDLRGIINPTFIKKHLIRWWKTEQEG